MGSDLIAPETLQEMRQIASSRSQQQYTHRTSEQVARFFEGTNLVEPGLVRVEEWRPEPRSGDTSRSFIWAASAEGRMTGLTALSSA